jgi:hypothetical protein
MLFMNQGIRTAKICLSPAGAATFLDRKFKAKRKTQTMRMTEKPSLFGDTQDPNMPVAPAGRLYEYSVNACSALKKRSLCQSHHAVPAIVSVLTFRHSSKNRLSENLPFLRLDPFARNSDRF